MSTIPSLALIPSGVKASKVYSVLPTDGSGDFDFTRSGNATRVNSEGLIELVTSNVPRLNYPLIDGVVSGCPSLLLEPSRTNTVLHSQELNNAYWVVSPGTFVTANEIISPDGTLNADKVSETTFNGVHQIYSGVISTTISVSNTYSVFAKKAERNWIKVQNGSTSQANFNLEDGTIGTVAGGTTAEIEDYGNGWYRCKISFIAPSSSDRLYVRLMTSDNVTSYLGDGISGVYLWGAQAEVGSYATSYIPTTTIATRSAETCNNAGDVNTFNDSEGVLFAEISALANDLTVRCISISSGNYIDSVQLRYWSSSNTLEYRVVDGSVIVVFLRPVINNIVESNKILVKYKSNDCSIWVNGFKIATDTSATMPSGLSELAFDDGNGTTPFYGNTKQIQYFPTALNDSDLETLTSWDSFSDMANGQLYSVE